MHGQGVEHMTIGPEDVYHACCWDGMEGELDKDHLYMNPDEACEHLKRLLRL